jgi:uncharacterized RmlC-like cupin family protein
MRNLSTIRTSAAALLFATLAVPVFAAGLQDAKTTPVLTTDGLTWQDVNAENFPKGMKVAILVSSGDYSVARIWMPPHTQIPPHMHSGNAEAVTIVGGEVGMGFGQTMDKTQAMFGPGGFFVLAEGDYHYVWTGDEPGIWDVQVENNSDTTFAPMKMN